MFHNGMSNNDKEFEMCMRVEGVVLPKSGFFGISAATGGLADDHDVLKFNVFSLRSPDQAVTETQDPEAKKFEEEFEQYQQKLKQQKDQWAKDNPEEVSLVLKLMLEKKHIFHVTSFISFIIGCC